MSHATNNWESTLNSNLDRDFDWSENISNINENHYIDRKTKFTSCTLLWSDLSNFCCIDDYEDRAINVSIVNVNHENLKTITRMICEVYEFIETIETSCIANNSVKNQKRLQYDNLQTWHLALDYQFLTTMRYIEYSTTSKCISFVRKFCCIRQ